MDPLTILAGIKTGLAAGKTVAGLSKQIGQFFDATDQAKKAYSKKRGSSSSVGAESLSRWADLQQKAAAEEELREWIVNTKGLSQWNELLKIRKEVLQEKRDTEARLKREAIERQELAVTLAGIFFLLTASAIGAIAYLHHMKWVNFWDWLP